MKIEPLLTWLRIVYTRGLHCGGDCCPVCTDSCSDTIENPWPRQIFGLASGSVQVYEVTRAWFPARLIWPHLWRYSEHWTCYQRVRSVKLLARLAVFTWLCIQSLTYNFSLNCVWFRGEAGFDSLPFCFIHGAGVCRKIKVYIFGTFDFSIMVEKGNKEIDFYMRTVCVVKSHSAWLCWQFKDTNLCDWVCV